MKEHRVNVRLESRHLTALKRIVKHLDCTASQAIRAAILRYAETGIPAPQSKEQAA